jgi:hypothetical protein
VSAPVALRFEDVTQDGRVVLEALPSALGPTIWRLHKDDPSARACFAHGILPILTAFSLEATPGPFSPHHPVLARATCRMARTDAGRFVLDMWAELFAPVAQTYGAPSQEVPQEALVGRVYAEHVLTRPFAPPGQRRVTSLDFEGAPRISETRPRLAFVEALTSLPEGARALDPAAYVDAVPLVFGVVHTDSNRHVNSLAYLRAFEEAALRRLVALGENAVRLGRRLDIAYRKPCFAGQVLRTALQAFEHGDRLSVLGMLIDEQDSSEAPWSARARTVARIEFEE